MRRRRGNGPSRRRYATTGTTLGNKASFTVAGRGYQPPCRPERRPAASSLPSSPHCTRVRRSTEHALPNGRRGGRYSAVLRISKLRRMLGLLCDAASAEKRAESPALAVDNTSVTSSLVSRAKIPASPHCSREAALGHLGRIRVSSKISAATEHPRLAGWTSHRLIHNHKWSANTGMLLTLSYTGEVPIRESCRGANMAGLASSLSGWRFSSNRSRSLLNWLLA